MQLSDISSLYIMAIAYLPITKRKYYANKVAEQGLADQKIEVESLVHAKCLTRLFCVKDYCTSKDTNWFLRPRFQKAVNMAIKTDKILIISNLDRFFWGDDFKVWLGSFSDFAISCQKSGMNFFEAHSARDLLRGNEEISTFFRSRWRSYNLKKEALKRLHSSPPSNIANTKRLKKVQANLKNLFYLRMTPVISEIKTELENESKPITGKALASALNERGVFTRQGKSWNKDSANRLLRNITQ